MRVPLDGDALRTLRTLNRRSTTSLAEAVGVTPAALCHIERGRRQSVSPAVYEALVRELGIEARPDWIMPHQRVTSDTPDSSPVGLSLRTSLGMVRGAGQNEGPAQAA